MTEANSINAATTGIVGNTGTSFTGTAVTAHNVIVGGSTSSTLTNVAPSATSGVPLVSNGASSDPSFTTCVVAGGGTGDTSLTAYTVLCGGTTSTGAIQSIASVGTSGQVLTSNGAAALPTFQTAAGNKAFSLNVQVFTSGTPTYTPTTNMVYCIIECVGSGGGGAGAATGPTSSWSTGAGGGGGAYSRKFASAATIGASQTVTVGAGGTAGTAGANPGGTGNPSSVGTICTAPGGFGGSGGSGTINVASVGGAGGGAGTGDFSIVGQAGGSTLSGSPPVQGANGGNTVLGFGGAAQVTTSASTGVPGTGYGGGGSGGISFNGSGAASGGAGAGGIVVITEYIFG